MKCPLCSSDNITDYRNCDGYVSCKDCGHVDYYEEFQERFQRQRQKKGKKHFDDEVDNYGE